MRAWILPASAACFGGGVLAFGSRAGPEAAVGLVIAGAALLGAAAIGGRRRRRVSAELLDAAGLKPEAPTPGPRDRILRAAGVGGDPEPVERTRPWRLVCLALGLALLGGGWSAVRIRTVPQLEALDGRTVAFAGSFASDPRRFSFGWGAEATVDRLELPEATVRVAARAWLRGRGPPPSAEPGQPVAGVGSLDALVGGESGFEDGLIARGVVVALRVIRLRPLGAPANPALRAANAARRMLSRGAERALGRREAGLLLGLSVGDTRALDPEVEEDFRATGLGHLLAVSGANVAMFLAPVLGVAALLRTGPGIRVAAGLAAVVFFALVTRWEPSVLRASVMAALALLGVLAGRPRTTVTLLGAAVLVLLVADPSLARSVGFQLSVAATVGIVALAGPLARRLSWLPRPLALAAAATVGAQTAVTPLLLLRFGVVPTVTLVANLLAFPAVPFALFGGLVASAAALLSEPVGRAVGVLASLPLRYLEAVADRLARAPLATLTAKELVGPLIVAVAAAVVGMRLARRRRLRASLLAACLAAVLLWSAAWRSGPPGTLLVTFLDVGQGDAAVVRTPEGGTVLVDAGPDEDVVAARLAALGVRRIDVAVATHAHADHIEGFPAVLARHPIGVLLEPGCPADSPSHGEFRRAVRDEGVRLHPARGGERLNIGRLLLEVLGPDGCTPGGDSPNDESVVLRLRYGGATILFPGDAEVPAQRDLLDDGDPVAATVLKVPHHGGDTSLPEFLAAVDPAVAVVSVGPNDYGHPVPAVLERLVAGGARVLRTDLTGDVTVRFEGGSVLVEE